MVPPDPRSIDRDGASRYPEKLRVEPALPSTDAAEPSPSCDSLNLAAGRQQAPRLHEPFVSPEFAESSERVARMGDRLGQFTEHGARFSRDIDRNNSVDSILSRMPHPEVPPPQAAPLYTVRAGGSSSNSGGVLVSPPTPIQDTQILTKRLAVTAAGRSSVVGPSSAVAPPASGGILKVVGGGPEQTQDYLFKPDKVLRPVQSNQEGDRLEPPLSITPEDLSPLVAGAVCTWGQELARILGQHAVDSAIPYTGGPALVSHTADGRLCVLTTTGNFPQTMKLRFSSPVHVTSVHVNASSVLRLVVHPSEGLFGDKYAGGKTVILPQNSCTSGESLEDAVGQDIDIDVRGLASFECTRSLSVTIAAGSRAFCNIGQIYALGTRV